jgi:hypothetical protein
MGRTPRLFDHGLVYHAINRRNNRADVLADGADHFAFLESLAITKESYPSFGHHGLGHDDPLLDPFPEWGQPGRTPAERRRRWRAKLRCDQGAAELASVRTPLKTGRPLGAVDRIERVTNRLNIELSPRPRGRPPLVK